MKILLKVCWKPLLCSQQGFMGQEVVKTKSYLKIYSRLLLMPQATKVIKLLLQGEESEFYSLDGQSKICNWLYNHLLEHANNVKKQAIEMNNFDKAKVIYTERGLRNLVPSLKTKHPFLKSVYSSPLKNVA